MRLFFRHRRTLPFSDDKAITGAGAQHGGPVSANGE